MMRLNPAFLALALLGFTWPTQAADYVYIPKDCEFRLTYPEEPSTAEACNPDNPLQCHQVSNFTRVYALDSSVRINTTCNPAETGMLTRYSSEVMQYTLQTMAKPRVDEFETGFNDHNIAKQAVLLGNKKLPDGTERVFMAQLWIGKKSVFTIEGEVSGASSAEADLLFSNILKSVRHESWDEPEKAEKPPKSTENKESGEKPEKD
jgi:hypothetical protein